MQFGKAAFTIAYTGVLAQPEPDCIFISKIPGKEFAMSSRVSSVMSITPAASMVLKFAPEANHTIALPPFCVRV